MVFTDTQQGHELLIETACREYDMSRQEAVALMNRNPDVIRNLGAAKADLELTLEELLETDRKPKRRRR